VAALLGRRPALILRTAFLLLFLAFLIYATFFAKWRPHGLEEMKADILAFGAAGPFVAVAIQAAGIVLLIPSAILVLATAIVFGLDAIWISILGQLLGTFVAFLIAHHVGRDPLHALLGQRLIALERVLEKHGFRTLVLLRLASVLPGPFLVYAPGLVGMKLRKVLLAALLGDLPFIIVLSLVGHQLADLSHPGELLQPGIFFPIAFLVLVLTLPILVLLFYRRRRGRAPVPAAQPEEPALGPSRPPL
jgi:uncharacterized membrane protein YdjX (TVP38/TMEM64 family)